MQIKYQQSTAKLKKENEILRKKIHSQSLKIKRLEDALRETEKETNTINNFFEEPIHQKSQLEQFTYIIAHDLQEPVRTIKGFSNLLSKKYADKFEAEVLTYLNYIEEGSGRISNLINDLLDYSRIGKFSKLERINCNNSLINAQNSLNILIDKADIIIESGNLPIINGYRKEFKLLLTHLLDNALKFRKPNEVLNISIDAEIEDDCWVFSVTDTGIGIKEDKLEDIFLVFRQLHARNLYEGTGIGLTHCKKIIELHQGKIWATSELGVGSTFYFMIPIINL